MQSAATPCLTKFLEPSLNSATNVKGGMLLPPLPCVVHSGQDIFLSAKGLVKNNDLCRPLSCVDALSAKRRGKSAYSHQHLMSRNSCVRSATINELYDTLKAKMQSGYYHAVHHAFKSFDPQGKGSVTKDALYRLLCNFLIGLSLQQFNLLLARINLNAKKVISFEEFYSKFRVAANLESNWLDPVRRHPHSHLSWQHVHSWLQERARNNLSSILSALKWQHVITKTTFRDVLKSISLTLSNEQYESLWKRYDVEEKGWLTLPTLLQRLDVPINDKKPKLICEASAINPNLLVKVKLIKQLNQLDTLQSGKINVADLQSALSEAGIKLSNGQLQEILQQLGFPKNKPVSYEKFIDLFTGQNEGSLSHILMTNKTYRGSTTQPMRIGTSADAQTSIVSLLQSKFLKLLKALKSHDPKNTGYVQVDDFKACIHKLLNCESRNLDHLISILCGDSGLAQTWVPYPKFLSMFDSESNTIRPFSSRPLVWYPPSSKQSLPALHLCIDTELLHLISDLVMHEISTLKDHFNDMNEQNTGRLTVQDTLELLLRCGIVTTEEKLLPLWEKLLKNKDGTVSFDQFVKEFSRSQPANKFKGYVRKRWTDDHCFMRSKTLHRDEDMLLEALRYKLAYYQQSLLKHFCSLDTSLSGLVTLENFEQTLMEMCPSLTHTELNFLSLKYQKGSTGYVKYREMLAFFSPITNPFRTGNSLGHLMVEHGKDVVQDTSPPHPIATKPNYGLPGVKGCLQKQLTKHWKEIRRSFRSLDYGCGNVSVSNFKKVLQQCGIEIDSEQLYHLLEVLDPQLSGQVNYHTFFNVIMKD